jgi:hypothetical protein
MPQKMRSPLENRPETARGHLIASEWSYWGPDLLLLSCALRLFAGLSFSITAEYMRIVKPLIPLDIPKIIPGASARPLSARAGKP